MRSNKPAVVKVLIESKADVNVRNMVTSSHACAITSSVGGVDLCFVHCGSNPRRRSTMLAATAHWTSQACFSKLASIPARQFATRRPAYPDPHLPQLTLLHTWIKYGTSTHHLLLAKQSAAAACSLRPRTSHPTRRQNLCSTHARDDAAPALVLVVLRR